MSYNKGGAGTYDARGGATGGGPNNMNNYNQMGMGGMMPINQQNMMYNAPGMPGMMMGQPQGYMPMMPGYYMPMMMPPNPQAMMPFNQDPSMMPGNYNPYSEGALYSRHQNQNMSNTTANTMLNRHYSQDQFNSIDNRRDDHFINLKNNNSKKNVHFSQSVMKNGGAGGNGMGPHNRNFSMQPPYGRDYDEELEQEMYQKPQRQFWTFEDFKQQTLPRLQLRKVIKIQALMRGAYVRKRRWPKLVLWHQGAIRYTDGLIDHYIEDVFVPDLVLEILTKNRIYENVDLYSDENKILYQIRQDIIEKVVRSMTKETVRTAQDQIVNEYLNKRFRTKTIDEQDPMRRVVVDMMERVMRGITKDVAKTQTSGIVFDYLIEAQFIGFFNNYYIRREVEHIVKDAIEDIAVGEVIEDMVDRIILEAVPIIAQGELNSEIKRQDKQEINYAFGEYLDRCVLEIIIDNLAKLYEEEDREINMREQTDKRRRDEIRSKSQAAKIEDDEFEKMSQMNKSIRSQRAMSQASRRSFNSQANGTGYNMSASGNPNVRDRYMANYPGGDPDFDRQDGLETPVAKVQTAVEEKKEEEKKEEPPKKKGGFFGFFKK